MNKLSYIIGAAALCLSASAAQAKQVTVPVNAPGILTLDVNGGCSNKGGSDITVDSEIALKSIPVTVKFSGGNGNHTQEVDATVVVELEFDKAFSIPKQPSADGVTGNPEISVLYDGKVLFGPVKCNKL